MISDELQGRKNGEKLDNCLTAKEYNQAIIKMLEEIKIEKSIKRIYKLILYLYTQETDGY